MASTGALNAARARSSNGSESTYRRMGTAGKTRSTKLAAVLAIRRPARLGQIALFLQEKATSKSSTLCTTANTTENKPLLTAREAMVYCGFKTTGALRKAAREGRIRPAGRRGGTGTWMRLAGGSA
jgi:hypothetical protein